MNPRRARVALTLTSLLLLTMAPSALAAGAFGHPYAITRSLLGTSLGAALIEQGKLFEVADPSARLQQFGHRLQERIPVPHSQRASRLEHGAELGVGKRDRRRHGGEIPRSAAVLAGIRDLASLSKSLARNRKP